MLTALVLVLTALSAAGLVYTLTRGPRHVDDETDEILQDLATLTRQGRHRRQ